MNWIVGPQIKKQINAVPTELLTEIVQEVQINQPNRKVIIDLCSGYQSMRVAAEQKGFEYVAVDILDYSRSASN